MYNGWTPTPSNPERIAYDAMQEQKMLARQWAAEQQRVNFTAMVDALENKPVEYNPTLNCKKVISFSSHGDVRTEEEGSDTSWKTQLHDAGFGEDGRL